MSISEYREPGFEPQYDLYFCLLVVCRSLLDTFALTWCFWLKHSCFGWNSWILKGGRDETRRGGKTVELQQLRNYMMCVRRVNFWNTSFAKLELLLLIGNGQGKHKCVRFVLSSCFCLACHPRAACDMRQDFGAGQSGVLANPRLIIDFLADGHCYPRVGCYRGDTVLLIEPMIQYRLIR